MNANRLHDIDRDRTNLRIVANFLNRNRRTVPSPDDFYAAARSVLALRGIEVPARLDVATVRRLLVEAGVTI